VGTRRATQLLLLLLLLLDLRLCQPALQESSAFLLGRETDERGRGKR
jgi:hypothetical protein